jgi:endonuclease-8
MPEGPEIRLAADRLTRVLAGRTPEQIELLLPGLARHAAQLRGKGILSVQPRSKAMLIHFAGDHSLYSHNQLYGRWYVVGAGKKPRTGRSLRLAIHTRDHSALLYSASDIAVLSAAQLRRHPYLCKLGPDLLDSDTTLAVVRAHVEEPRFQRRSLASLLLDQAFFAGLGNYLRSEILHVAGLSHELTLGALDAAVRLRLADTALAITRQAYRCRGVTNDLERAAQLKAEGMGYAHYRHHVFAREGEDCWTCNTSIQRVDISGRAVFFCPRCQAHESRRSGSRIVRRH